MKKVTGNLVSMASAGKFNIIVHGCNCFHTMGAGIARQIRSTWPEVYKADLNTKRGDKGKLGRVSYAEVRNRPYLVVINAYTQYNYGRGGRYVSYDAVKSCFEKIASGCQPGHSVGIPYIGCGLAGGDWKVIEPIIDEAMVGIDLTLVEFK